MINTFEILSSEFGLSKKVIDIEKEISLSLKDEFSQIDMIYEYNQFKVLSAFRQCAIREQHFAGTTGYGYDDIGREAIDALYAKVFECEDALVRHSIVSGTHALSLCMFAVLRPGDRLLSVTGKPYDTLESVISAKDKGSLADFGINYSEVALGCKGLPNYEAIKASISSDVKAVLIQRSKGYDWRPTLTVAGIVELISFIKSIREDIVCIIDNCYGEFTQTSEPTKFGADLVAGSLIKNPGGGIARGGAYIAGKKKYIELAAYKLNCVGQGKKVGPTFGLNREILQGFFMAPHITAQALKAAIFCGRVFHSVGFEVCPNVGEARGDIIQAIKFGTKEGVIAFCQGIQKGAPIDSFVTPEPWDMPGYDCPVIMAAGAFTQGSTTELSADAPIKPPYIAYMQGSLTYECGKIGVLVALQNLINLNLI